LNSSLAHSCPRPPPVTSPMLYIILRRVQRYSRVLQVPRRRVRARPARGAHELLQNWLQGPADAMRAVRKNGEIHGGSWMLGAKWAVCAHVRIVFSASLTRTCPPGRCPGRGAPEPPHRAAQLTRPDRDVGRHPRRGARLRRHQHAHRGHPHQACPVCVCLQARGRWPQCSEASTCATSTQLAK
jgi:hypothetical protein